MSVERGFSQSIIMIQPHRMGKMIKQLSLSPTGRARRKPALSPKLLIGTIGPTVVETKGRVM